MEERISQMVVLLDEECQVYSHLLELARKKQQFLIGGQLTELEQLLSQEQEALKAATVLEEERYALQCDLAQLYGSQPGELTVTALAELAGHSYGPRLKESQHHLVKLVNDLSALNQSSAELIQQSLAYINFTMDAVAGATFPAAYNRDGSRKKRQVGLRFFNRQV